jgi:hypothetical protein
MGTVDYVSTLPWNDPANPWPQYFQVSLSAAEISLRTFTLVSFDPNAAAFGQPTAHYEDDNGDYRLDYDASGQYYGNGASWNVWSNMIEDLLYFKTTLIRAIPFKAAGVADGWEAGGSGTDQSILYMQPDVASLNPWEYRRRRLLEIV